MPYLEDGDMVEVLATFQGGVVVQRLFEETDEDAGLYASKPFIVTRVFDEAPIAKREDRINKLDDYIKRLAAQRDALTAELAAAKTSLKTTQNEIAEFKRLSITDAAMKRVADLISGNITHVVMADSYDPKFMSVKDAVSGGWRPNLRLLTLNGNADTKELSWLLSRDDHRLSEYESKVIPCTSVDEAREIVRPMVISKLNHSSGECLERNISNAVQMGIEVDQRYHDKVTAEKTAAADEKRKKLEAELAKLTEPVAS